MFMRKILSFITATTLAFGLFAHTPKTTTVKAESNDFDCTYSVSSNGTSTNLGYYGAKEVISYTEEEAIKAGIPSGFSGDVLEVIGLNSSETNKGVVLDFSHLNIPSWTIESITFRVYVSSDTNTTDGYPEIRIPKPYEPYSWSLRYYDIKNNIAKWHDVVLTQDNFYENGTMADLSTDGYLDKFELGLRHSNVADFYIDSIKVKQVEDTVAPVINYEGRDNEIISQGQTLNFKVSAIDAVQGEVDVELIWGDSSRLDENGNPLLGTHTLTFRATDYFGNVAEHTITVIVIESDSTAPEFTIPTDKAYVKTGTIPRVNVVAIDDVDGEIEVVQSWSENALNQYGELNEGTHVLTLTATDSNNNKTVKTITFYVTKTGDSSDVVVDEEELCPEEESESESEEESEFETISEEESEEESTSSKESSSQEDSATSKDSQESKSGSSAGCTGSMSGFVGIFGILIIAVIVFILIRRRRY